MFQNGFIFKNGKILKNTDDYDKLLINSLSESNLILKHDELNIRDITYNYAKQNNCIGYTINDEVFLIQCFDISKLQYWIIKDLVNSNKKTKKYLLNDTIKYDSSTDFLKELYNNTISNNLQSYYINDISNIYSETACCNFKLNSFQFANNQTISSVYLANCRYIPVDCFGNCQNLQHVFINSDVSVIQHEAFEYCNNLKQIELPNTILSIEYDSFYNCSMLSHINLPNSLKYIGNGAFDSCINLLSIVIPDSILSINCYTFQNCIQLTTCYISKNINYIGLNAFKNCKSLKNIIFY